jgi:hypothetical protein
MSIDTCNLTPLQQSLIRIAIATVLESLRADTLEEITADTLEDWGDGDWSHYVNEDVRLLWPQLDLGQKLIAYIGASAWAKSTEWALD